MIRFGVVLTVVLAAMGLLAGGVLANSLPLVYLAIGTAALAALMLTIGVLIWREEVFGPSPAAEGGQATRQAVGPSPVLTATGAAPTGWSVGGPADDVAANGAAAAQDDFVVEPPPPALPPHPDWSVRQGPQGYPDWPAPPELQQQDWLQRSDRPERQEQPGRAKSSDRPNQPGRAKRSDRPARQAQPDWAKSSDRPEQQDQPDWAEPSDRPERRERLDRIGSSGKPERPEQPDSVKPSDRPQQQERLEPVAEPAAQQGSVRRERSSGSPSGVWPEPPAEPVPGSRRDDQPASRGVLPASGGAAAADELWPRPPREPAAQSQDEIGADAAAWSFFTKAARSSAARPDVTEVVGADTGAVRPGESGGPAGSREPARSRRPGGSHEPAKGRGSGGTSKPDGTGEPREGYETGGSPVPDESPKAARTAEAAAPDAARPPDGGTAEGEIRAAAAPDGAHSATGPAAGRDRLAAGPVERDALAEPAEPESASAVTEEAAPNDAILADPEAKDEPPAVTTMGAAVRDGHAARGPDTEVTVVPGITRYHRSHCILIRFLGPEDLETMTLQAAEMASYMPCKACRPEQVLAGD